MYSKSVKYFDDVLRSLTLPFSACFLHVIHIFRMWVGSFSRIAVAELIVWYNRS